MVSDTLATISISRTNETENETDPFYYARQYAPNLVKQAAAEAVPSDEYNASENETEANDGHNTDGKDTTSCRYHEDVCPIPYNLTSIFVLRYNTHGDLGLSPNRKVVRLSIDHTHDSSDNRSSKSHTRASIELEPSRVATHEEQDDGRVGHGAVLHKQGCFEQAENWRDY